MKYKILFLLIIILALLNYAYSINTFIVEETEKIVLQTTATDPDSDNLAFTYTPPLNENGEWQTAYGDAGEYKATVTVSDGTTNTSEDILIIVNKKEEQPKIEAFTPEEEQLSVNEGAILQFSVSATDLNNDPLSYEWFLDDEKVKEGKEFSYEVSYTDAGTHKVIVEISDDTTKLSKEWSVVVNEVDRLPIFESIGNRYINEGEELVIELKANDPDGDEITYSADNLPEGARLEGNIFTWKTNHTIIKREDFVDWVMDKFGILSKSFYVKFSVSSRDKTIVQNVIITVKDINTAPVLEDIGPITINEGETLKIMTNAYDLDGDKISLSYSGFINSDTFKSDFDDEGTYFVRVTASDGLLETSKSVEINIKNTNRVPFFSKIDSIKANEGDSIAISLNAQDPDRDNITFSIDNPPEDSFLKGNVFSWAIGFDVAEKTKSKKIDIVFVATDGSVETRQIMSIEIADKNRAPKIINASKNIVANVNKPILLYVKAIDEDGDELTYTWDFGFLEKYKATATHKRIFTTKGTKVIKVIVSDGTDKTEQIINVNVI